MADYYHILGVLQTASDKEIKKAFRQLAKQYHPDKNIGDEYADERFKQINEAYQILSDRIKKAQYDAVLNYKKTESYRQQTYQQPSSKSSAQRKKAHPHQAEVKPLTEKQKKWIAKKRRERHIKAFNRMAVFLVVFLLGFGSVVGVIEVERAQERAHIAQIKTQRVEDLKYWQMMFDDAFAAKDFINANNANIELIKLNSPYYEINRYKINKQVLALGDEQYDNMAFEKAKDHYEFYLSLNPKNNNVISLRIANCYLQLGNTVEAERMFTITCEALLSSYTDAHGTNFYYSMNPEFVDDYHFEAFMGQGISSFMNQNYIKCKSALTFAQFLRPKQPIIYQYLAQVEEKLGDDEMAAINRELQIEYSTANE